MHRLGQFRKQIFSLLYITIAIVYSLCQPCSSNFVAPTRVIGIFTRESQHGKCVPGTATSVAVNLFNRQYPVKFSYENVPVDRISNLIHSTSSVDLFNNSIVITEDSYVCERLSDVISNLASFLVCYGTPTTRTLESLQMRPNTFLSQPNPDAILHCLFKLIRHIVGEEQNSATAALIYNDDHPYRHVFTGLKLNLRSAYRDYDRIFNEIPYTSQDQTLLAKKKLEHLTLVNALLHEKEASDLLCQSIQGSHSIENCSLIFVGLTNKNWLEFNDTQKAHGSACDSKKRSGEKQKQNICSGPELRTAAEGHLILEYPLPAWSDSGSQESIDISKAKGHLREKLQECSVTLAEYEEAPLAFDSVWAILKAVNRASRENEGVVNVKSVGQALVSKAFAGLTGEKVSFIKYKNGENSGCVRNTADATIIVYRFELGEYLPIARHFNANNSFQWMHELRPGGRHTWNPSRPECPDFLKQAGRDILVMSLFLSLLLTVLLFGVIFLCFQYLRV